MWTPHHVVLPQTVATMLEARYCLQFLFTGSNRPKPGFPLDSQISSGLIEVNMVKKDL